MTLQVFNLLLVNISAFTVEILLSWLTLEIELHIETSAVVSDGDFGGGCIACLTCLTEPTLLAVSLDAVSLGAIAV